MLTDLELPSQPSAGAGADENVQPSAGADADDNVPASLSGTSTLCSPPLRSCFLPRRIEEGGFGGPPVATIPEGATRASKG